MKWHGCALLVALAASGCASLADRIVEPHSNAHVDVRSLHNMEYRTGTVRERIATPEGVDLAYRRVPAALRGMQYHVTRDSRHLRFDMSFEHAPTALPVRGTIVYLHGWGEDASSMLPWAWAMSEHGYRGIAVDLRNSGESSRAPVGMGPREAADVVALLHGLQQRGELQRPVYLFGVSYGATTALFAEPALRGRIDGIIAMEPYANAADAIRGVMTGIIRDSHPAAGLLLHAYTRRAYSPAAIDRGIAEAGVRLHLDLASVDARPVMAHTQTCTLLVHGEADTWLPANTTRAMANLAPGVHFTAVPAENHLTLPARIDWLAPPLADWLQARSRGLCVAMVLPPGPAHSD